MTGLQEFPCEICGLINHSPSHLFTIDDDVSWRVRQLVDEDRLHTPPAERERAEISKLALA